MDGGGPAGITVVAVVLDPTTTTVYPGTDGISCEDVAGGPDGITVVNVLLDPTTTTVYPGAEDVAGPIVELLYR